MTISYGIKLYLVALVVFLGIDLLWLGVVARNLYRKYLGHLMADPVNWTAAMIFYLIFVAGLVYFALAPGLQAGSLWQALLRGLLYGFFTYATYDLTNLATLKGWPLPITLIDITWGVALAGMVTGITYGLLVGR